MSLILRANVLNDVTAGPFSVFSSQLPAAKNTKNGAAVTSLRTFVQRRDFRSSKYVLLEGTVQR